MCIQISRVKLLGYAIFVMDLFIMFEQDFTWISLNSYLNTLAPAYGFERVMIWRCRSQHCPLIDRDTSVVGVYLCGVRGAGGSGEGLLPQLFTE